MRITVVNRLGRNGAVYIGRGGHGVPGSPLANPRRLGDPKPTGGVWERGETIEVFEQDLRAVLDPARPVPRWWDGRTGRYRELREHEREEIRAEMRRLGELARRGLLELDCFCSPRPCHGEVIRKLLLEAAG